jgi:hypothetical protein
MYEIETPDEASAAGVRAGLAAVVELTPGVELVRLLADVAPAETDTGQLVDAAVGWERVIAWATACQAGVVAEFARRRPAADPRDGEVSEFAADELAAALSLSRGTAGSRIGFALELSRLPQTSAALAAGRIGLGPARRIADALAVLPTELATAVEAQVVPTAFGRTASQVQAAAAKAVLKADPAAAERRRRAAVRERRVEMYAQPDGMASIWALLRAEEASALMARLRSLAACRTPGDTRRYGERMADVFADLLGAEMWTASGPEVDGTPAAVVPRPAGPSVRVVVAATTLLGLDEEPGHLGGYGPIPAAVARELAGDPDSTWRRLLTDPVSKTLLDVGRTRYRPPASLAEHVRTRDRTCRFPGCRQPAERCDLDHVVPYPDGTTCDGNLGTECRHHHRLKHEGGWRVDSAPGDPGALTWIDPTGHRYTTYPPKPLDAA